MNAVYDKARQSFLDAQIPWSSGNMKAVLVQTTGGSAYTVNLATHQFLTDVSVGSRIGTTGNLMSKSSTTGVAGSADVATFVTSTPALVGGAVILYYDTGVEATSRLIAYIDTAVGLPITTDGSNVAVTWGAIDPKIFKL